MTSHTSARWDWFLLTVCGWVLLLYTCSCTGTCIHTHHCCDWVFLISKFYPFFLFCTLFLIELMRLQTAHATDTEQNHSLPPKHPFPISFVLHWSTHHPTDSSHSFNGSLQHPETTRTKCSIINCWHAEVPKRGKHHTWLRRRRMRRYTKKVGDKRLLCATTAWLNWVTRTGGDSRTLNSIHQNPHREAFNSGESGYVSATEAIAGVKWWGKTDYSMKTFMKWGLTVMKLNSLTHSYSVLWLVTANRWSEWHWGHLQM